MCVCVRLSTWGSWTNLRRNSCIFPSVTEFRIVPWVVFPHVLLHDERYADILHAWCGERGRVRWCFLNGKWPDLLGLKLQNKNLSWNQLLEQFCQEFLLVGDEQSLWFSLICVFVSPTWFSHTDGPPLCKTTSSPTLWPICEVTEQRWERCTIFLALVLWYIFFYGRNFRQIWSSREVKPAACDSVELQLDRWWNDLLIYNKGALHYLHTSLCYLQNNIHTIMFFLSFIMSLFYFDSAPSSCVHLTCLSSLTSPVWSPEPSSVCVWTLLCGF